MDPDFDLDINEDEDFGEFDWPDEEDEEETE